MNLPLPVIFPSNLTPQQSLCVSAPFQDALFLHGPAGCGKTTAATMRYAAMLDAGIPAGQILFLLPQRSLAAAFYRISRHPDLPPGGATQVLTLSGLARRSIDLFWPLIAADAGFSQPSKPPIFLTLETAQFFMARLVTPLLEQGYFGSLTIDPNRLFSQILDNLNKAAAVGMPYQSIGERLKSAWSGEPAQLTIYDQAQECAEKFRQFCLQNNLLDFSLQIEVFSKHVWHADLFQRYLNNSYNHLIYDNMEEDIPVTHDLVRSWLPKLQSALLIFDEEGGYRSFLGADPDSAASLRVECQGNIHFTGSLINQPAHASFASAMASVIHYEKTQPPDEIHAVFEILPNQFYTDMVNSVAQRIASLVDAGEAEPGQIAVLSPFLSDSLRFTLSQALQQRGVPCRSHRPSRSLRDEPAAACLLAFAKVAHPAWQIAATHSEMRSALLQSIAGIDLVRADLLAQTSYHERKAAAGLGEFSALNADMQQRITFTIGNRFDALRAWLNVYLEEPTLPLDIFISRLFGEVLSQPGFGFHQNYDAAAAAARLAESARKFRLVTTPLMNWAANETSQEYVRMADAGLLSALYLPDQLEENQDAVFIAPAHTFLMHNTPVNFQFWLDIGSQGWWERLYQPLTQPYVLQRGWEPGSIWSDALEVERNQYNMARMITGLVRRCSGKLFLCFTAVNEMGMEQRGPLLTAVQRLLRDCPPPEVNHA
jgi:hypothetical protein